MMLLYNSLGLIWFLFILISLKLLALDFLRYKLFRLRHELFLLAFDNKLDYDTTLYRTFENSINGVLRFANRISYVEVCLFSIWFKWRHPNIIRETALEREFKLLFKNKNYSSDLKEGLGRIKYEMNKALFIYLLVTSPTFFIIIVCTFIKTVIEYIFKIYIFINKETYKMIIPVLIKKCKNILTKINYQSELCSA